MQLIRYFIGAQDYLQHKNLTLETIKRNDGMSHCQFEKGKENKSLPYLSNPFDTAVLSVVPRIHCDLHYSQWPVQLTNALNISLKLHKFDSYYKYELHYDYTMYHQHHYGAHLMH